MIDVNESEITPPKGFTASGISCGLKQEDLDMALFASDRDAVAAGMFTTNRVFAAPIVVNREHIASGPARAVVVNSHNANACTGERGLADARQMATSVARRLNVSAQQVLVNSTGVIGVPLPMDKIEKGIDLAAADLSEAGWEPASRAIMTTDTVPKTASMTIQIQGETVTLCGLAKGAGMIAPNMATMLAFVFTDAGLPPDGLSTSLQSAVRRSFNSITVDGDMSTNDTVLALANGASGVTIEPGPDLDAFNEALEAVSVSLAKQIARDGEGATKLITIRVTGARSDSDARTVGLSVANSSLVKTAVFGRDPNWGRILCDVGYAGADIQPDQIRVSMAGIPIFAGGAGLSYDREAAIQALGASDVDIDIDLGEGTAGATVYTCDLTYDYVRINAEYTT
jgi:glutamate N-acetyltransferase/amino-acid N-acetyltransferase